MSEPRPAQPLNVCSWILGWLMKLRRVNEQLHGATAAPVEVGKVAQALRLAARIGVDGVEALVKLNHDQHIVLARLPRGGRAAVRGDAPA